jgi:RNA polymerase sigma-70 factor (ECF subfamily)
VDPAAKRSRDLSDEEVIAAVLAGDVALFEVVMRRYNQRLYRVARAITKSESEAEDVVQDAYVRAYTHLSELEERARLAPWLTRICAHEAMRRLRGARPSETEESVMQFPAGNRSPEEGASDRELAGVLERAVDALPDAFRAVFVLRAVEELSVSETAECLEIPEDTVKTRFFRARAQLRDDLERKLEAGAPRVFGFDGERCDRIVACVLERIRG